VGATEWPAVSLPAARVRSLRESAGKIGGPSIPAERPPALTTFADAEEVARPDRVPRRVWRGAILQVLGRVWSATCTLGILFLTSGRLSDAGFDAFTFYLAAFAWLDAFVVLGTGQVAIQRTAGAPDSVAPVLRAARRIRLGTGLAGVLLVGGGAFAFGESGAPWILLAALYPLTHGLEISTIVFKNRISWGKPVLVRSIAATLSAASVATLWHVGVTEPALYLVGVAFGSTLGNFGLHWIASPHLPRVRGVAPAPGLLAAAIPIGLSGLCAQTYFYVDNLFVRAWTEEGELGRYNVAVRFMSIFIMGAQYVSTASLPWLTRRHAAGRLGAAVGRIGPPLFAAAGVGAGLAFPWTETLLELFRPGFGEAAASLQWLLGAVVCVYAGAVSVTAVVASGATRAVLGVSATGLALNLFGNAWAVPRFGIDGAAATTCATEATVVLAAWIALARRGVRVAGGWTWLGGPLGFGLGCLVSSALPLAG